MAVSLASCGPGSGGKTGVCQTRVLGTETPKYGVVHLRYIHNTNNTTHNLYIIYRRYIENI